MKLYDIDSKVNLMKYVHDKIFDFTCEARLALGITVFFFMRLIDPIHVEQLVHIEYSSGLGEVNTSTSG